MSLRECMRYCPIFWLLPNENFIEGSLDRDAFRLHFVVLVEHVAQFHNGVNHEMYLRHGRRKIFRATPSRTSENAPFKTECNLFS